MSRFVIQESEQKNNYVVTDTINGYVLTFEKGKFNESQEITSLEEENPSDYMLIAKIMREISEWITINHLDKVI